MNYRHAFHAGNFADVVKHVVLTRIIVHLRTKPTAFRVIDTHAGAGLYDLTGDEANRTGEWRLGIGRLLVAAPQSPDVQALLAPYLDAVLAGDAGAALQSYPGSPLLALKLLRPQDRLVACELVPAAATLLARHLRADHRAKAVAIDGWMALNAYVPPQERRGVVLIDPPFEESGEYGRLAEAVVRAHRKWPTGIMLLWYPIKDPAQPQDLARRLRDSDIAKMLRAELDIGAPAHPGGLSGTGVIVINPPWRLADELRVLLAALAALLAQGPGGGFRLDWIGSQP
jgi:23S rRNA (adenine2030-N6)-methyltransferase